MALHPLDLTRGHALGSRTAGLPKAKVKMLSCNSRSWRHLPSNARHNVAWRKSGACRGCCTDPALRKPHVLGWGQPPPGEDEAGNPLPRAPGRDPGPPGYGSPRCRPSLPLALSPGGKDNHISREMNHPFNFCDRLC
ncbi:unnamed protein product [Caretta caretta]